MVASPRMVSPWQDQLHQTRLQGRSSISIQPSLILLYSVSLLCCCSSSISYIPLTLKINMYPKTFIATAALALGASAQMMNLTALLGSESSLSALVTLLQQYPNLASTLASQQDVTLFAPNNAAIQQLTQSGALNMATEAQISEILLYHVLPSRVYASDITSTPAFVNTALVNATYTNVTNEQVVGAVLDGDNVMIESGLKMESQVVKAVSPRSWACVTGATSLTFWK